MTHAVSAADRQRDRFALAIVAAGMLVYLVSFAGMHALAKVPIVADAAHPALARFTRLWYLSRVGLLLVALGGGAMAWAFWRYRSRAPESP